MAQHAEKTKATDPPGWTIACQQQHTLYHRELDLEQLGDDLEDGAEGGGRDGAQALP